ncbi:hypothetical protein Pmani_031241 [Petrolisthes manimaculis]|uniref:Uncharacterized protein n=1 Tax=Petrolisthes manimaculis TaxID=1843537 RepID=A0AAE1TSU3_9EUCA|nr:hypothetical protein Pmani_031241 [Petrolisthes manimaculis]
MVCITHFVPDAYERSLYYELLNLPQPPTKTKLKSGAIPTLHLPRVEDAPTLTTEARVVKRSLELPAFHPNNTSTAQGKVISDAPTLTTEARVVKTSLELPAFHPNNTSTAQETSINESSKSQTRDHDLDNELTLSAMIFSTCV